MTQIPEINTVLELIEKFPDANNYTSREVYSRDVYEFFQAMGRFTANEIAFKDELNNAILKMNTVSGEINDINTNVNDKAVIANEKANEASNSALEAEGYKNQAEAAVASLPIGTLNDSITGLTTTWSSQKISNELSNKANSSDLDLKLNATNPVITGSITEQVYNLTGTVISPANGTIQYKTVSANTTFTETLTAGQSVILRLIGANGKTITFPTITWVGAVTPILTANCAIVLWKEQSTLYGAYVGTLV